MVVKEKRMVFAVVIFVIVFSGCANSNQKLPTPIPSTTPTNTMIPSPTPTITPTITPTRTPVPTPTIINCDIEQTMKKLKDAMPYDEFALHHQYLKEKKLLVIWFVDPNIGSGSTTEEVQTNVELVVRHALELNHQLKTLDVCMSREFDLINTIVVDRNYNGWISTVVDPNNIPMAPQLDEQQINELSQSYAFAYKRTDVINNISSVPSGKCSWKDASDNIYSHFASERTNVAFYLVIDETGVNIYGQWDSGGLLQNSIWVGGTSVALEIRCLFPQPDRLIAYIVDDSGVVEFIGGWPWKGIQNLDFNQMNVLYQK